MRRDKDSVGPGCVGGGGGGGFSSWYDPFQAGHSTVVSPLVDGFCSGLSSVSHVNLKEVLL